METKKLVFIPKLDKRLKSELKNDLKKIPRLDEKRIAIRQFIEEVNKLKEETFDFIAYPLFSGLIPATLFNILYKEKLPLFEYITISSLAENTIASEKGDYKIIFEDKAKVIIDDIKNNLTNFVRQNKIDIARAKILLIDSNVAKGITIAYFVKVLDEIGYDFKNLTLVITDSRANDEKIKKASGNLLKGGKVILFNNKNMTNKVFDNVLTLSANKTNNKTFKIFDGKNIKYDKKQISFYPYFLSLALLEQENKVKK
ncbi:MAG: hypothetical protein WCG28_04400 [bacterium]